jgi:hypothetical protein
VPAPRGPLAIAQRAAGPGESIEDIVDVLHLEDEGADATGPERLRGPDLDGVEDHQVG